MTDGPSLLSAALDAPLYVRCRECWVATGKKRPRSHWTRKDNT